MEEGNAGLASCTAMVGEPGGPAAARGERANDMPADPGLDTVASLAARLFGAPMAGVALAGEDRVRSTGSHGPVRTAGTGGDWPPFLSAPQCDTLCVVPDTLADPRTATHPLVSGEPGIRFYAAAPIVTARGERLGTVSVLDTRPCKPTDDQLGALEDLAALVTEQVELRLSAARTIAAERAQRTAAERLARTLQRTLLPPALPTVPGLDAAAAYHPASVDEVGGDFYDLFPLDDGRWAFFLGDVCGKGADAAALTSLTRYTLRAAAIYEPDPCAVLANLDAVLKGEHQGNAPRYCTAVFGILQPEADGSFTLDLAGGGHPPALSLRAGGLVEPVSTDGGQLIGMLPEPRFVQTTTRLRPGDSLLLYTDGLTEALTPDGTMLGEDGLAHHLSACAPAGADDLLGAVHALLTELGAGVSDDTALLALHVPVRRTTPSAQENR
ncbi:GAF domain-containing SpoIIE family protein phosphatase [Streptomyces sp. NPDC046831]|uniref:PP2C family protein-serine/threonine phosphatase n=1 Tax=Streptomyces sp. NPDC046831 TaxID=3154805 RepID=UPI0033D275D2